MIITISGRPGSGKSTIAKMLAEKLHLKHYSTGDFMRAMAKNKSISLLDLSKLAESNPKIDEELDERQRSLALNEDNFVLDARLGFYFIPFSFKVFLKVSPEEAARRIVNREKISFKDALHQSNIRINSEHSRYLKMYKLNYEDEKHFSLVIDTDGKSPDAIVKLIVDASKGL